MFIKGFDKDLKCRGMQFEIGKEYKIANTKKPELCTDSVFHYCETLQQVHQFYSALPSENNRFCEIIPLSKEVFDNNKRGAKKIKIVREIIGDELTMLRGLINGNTGIFNSGHQNRGDQNSGHRNSGNWNRGDQNSGNWNRGDQNSGNWNSGDRNSGNWNSGDQNSGDQNSGDWNSGDRNSGFFNTETPEEILVFNKPCKRVVWEEVGKPSFLYFDLTVWVHFSDMSGEEKAENPKAKNVGGFIKTLGYKEAFQRSYNSLPHEEKIRQTAQLKALPNFDADVFFEISGIRID